MVRIMSDRRFQWGTAYFLTDVKEGVFVDEPAVCVGKKDSDMGHPTICAVCGEPLGAKGYTTFCFKGPKYNIDMMIGNGCIKERIKEKEIDICNKSPYDTLKTIVTDFPQTGRWYGTFLHHNIAKPYVKNKKNAEKWDESTLNLPGVKYIMDVIDNLRDNGWNLDAEMRLDCGNVDLLATRPEGTIVFDWKSDLCFDNHETYIEQVEKYMSELNNNGWNNISGYILWIREEKEEYVRFSGNNTHAVKNNRSGNSSPSIRCTLKIEMNGGDGIKKKTISSESYHRVYGDEVSFYIPSYNLSRHGYDFSYFEATPYREGEHEQFFDENTTSQGFRVNFLCSNKRRTFTLTAFWKKIRPYGCTIILKRKDDNKRLPLNFINVMSSIDEENKDYIDLEISKINDEFKGSIIKHISLIDEDTGTTRIDWDSDKIHEGMHIIIPDIDGKDRFMLLIETIRIEKKNNNSIRPKELLNDANIHAQIPSACNDISPYSIESDKFTPYTMYHEDLAKYEFTPGYTYRSGSKLYKIYERKESRKENTHGAVKVAEVDFNGKAISNQEWRCVYTTLYGKEFIYSISNRNWKIYTKDVLIKTSLENTNLLKTKNEDMPYNDTLFDMFGSI